MEAIIEALVEASQVPLIPVLGPEKPIRTAVTMIEDILAANDEETGAPIFTTTAQEARDLVSELV
jgi:hypothetical protein